MSFTTSSRTVFLPTSTSTNPFSLPPIFQAGRVGDAADMAGLTLLLCSRGGSHLTGTITATAGGAELFSRPARVQGAKPGTVFGGPKL